MAAPIQPAQRCRVCQMGPTAEHKLVRVCECQVIPLAHLDCMQLKLRELVGPAEDWHNRPCEFCQKPFLGLESSAPRPAIQDLHDPDLMDTDDELQAYSSILDGLILSLVVFFTVSGDLFGLVSMACVMTYWFGYRAPLIRTVIAHWQAIFRHRYRSH